MTDRIGQLQELLQGAMEARALLTTSVWEKAWNTLEREYVERLLKCGPADDEVRYRLQIAIEASRRVRSAIETGGRSVEQLEKELALLEGRKPAAIA